MSDGAAPRRKHDFFVSCTEADRGWGEWIAWQLESAERLPGQPFRVLLAAWDFVPGDLRPRRLADAIDQSERILVVWSSRYARSPFDQPEWGRWESDPGAGHRRILPVRVEQCPLAGLLRNTVPVDLFGMAKDRAAATLLGAVRATTTGRGHRPEAEPAFPGVPDPAADAAEPPRDPGDPDDPAAWPEYRDIAARIAIPSERATWLGSAGGNAGIRRCLLMTCRYLFEAGQYADSRGLAHEMREQLRRDFGPDHEDTLTAGHCLSRAMAGQGESQAALELTDDVLACRRAVLGPYHRDTLSTAANRGVFLAVRQRFDEAQSQLETTLRDRQRFLTGDDDPDVLSSLMNLGTYWRGRHRYDEALRYHQQAQDGFARLLDGRHPRTLAARADVGLDLLLLGRASEARPPLTVAYDGRIAALGENHPATLESAQYLVAALDTLGEHDDALCLGDATLSRYCQVFGKDDPRTRAIQQNMLRIRGRKP